MFAKPSKIHEIETAKKWLITALVVQNSSSSSIEDFGEWVYFFLIVLIIYSTTFIDFACLIVINDEDDLHTILRNYLEANMTHLCLIKVL